MNVLSPDFDLTTSIATDPQGQVLKAVKDALEGMKTVLRKDMDAGLTVEDYKLANNLHIACQKGQELVEQFWSQPRK
ncbi:hypothetical protein LJC09_01175 [Desulfovibrio sp. OttesenSCG-928-F20]|nr:hypothetical protein [Desulfovibrio sp. OttesenSCG-928-F20]